MNNEQANHHHRTACPRGYDGGEVVTPTYFDNP